MSAEIDELRTVINAMARLVAEVATGVARTGAFDDHDPEHVNALLVELDKALRAARLRGADHHLLEAQVVLRNEERAPRLCRKGDEPSR